MLYQFAEQIDVQQREQFLSDIPRLIAEDKTADSSLIRFEITGYQRPPYRGQRSFGIEGLMTDGDGIRVSVNLYADANGRVLELEFLRWDAGDIVGLAWETLEFL